MTILNSREYKKYLILNFINHYGSISRTEIANLTDYRAATISDIIKELMEDKLIMEKGSVYAGQGRRRTLLELNDDYICAIGLSITSSEIIYIVSTINGNILKKVVHQLTSEHSADQVVDTVLFNINNLISDFSSRKILGIGISDPGVLDSYQEYSLYSIYFKGWGDVHLKSIVEKATGLSVKIASRNQLIALAEKKSGLAQGKRNFMCLELSKGIGMSFVCNGLIVTGSTNMAGEIGHTFVHGNDKLCYCGNIGCVEASTSLVAITKEILNALDQNTNTILNKYYDRTKELTVSDIRKALDSNDSMCINIVKRAARLIGIAVANAINILNPELIIMTGEMIGLGDYFLNTIKETANENTLPFFNGDIKFEISNLMEIALPIGAVTMFFTDFLKSEQFPHIYNIDIAQIDRQPEQQ